MKILIVYPYCLEDRIHVEDVQVPPIGLYYVGALLKERGYDVELRNWHGARNNPGLIQSDLRQVRPDVIGFSVLHANRWGAIEIARMARKLDPGIRIVFGGIGPSLLWEHFLRHFDEVDFCVLGEGEYAFLNLIQGLERGEPPALEGIPGIAFRRDGLAVSNGFSPPIADLDSLPHPAASFAFQHVVSSRGCPSQCSFCGSPKFWGRRVRFHSPAYFVEELALLAKRGIRSFYFSDDTFTLNKDRVLHICEGILQRGLNISWVAISRVDCMDEEILYWMRRAGCTQISYGVESGSRAIRRFFNKNITDEEIKRAFALTRSYGILPRAYFIYGSPGETWATIEETLSLMGAIQPLSTIFYLLDLFPGTALYEDFLHRTGLTDDIWLQRKEDIPYFETDPMLNEDLIKAFGHRLRSAFQEALPGFADALSLVDREDLYPLHADFLSRLGMTFSHGEYAREETAGDRKALAARLYQRALTYHPDERAFLGLGILFQQQADYRQSLHILLKGLSFFPESEQLHLCLGITHLALGDPESGLSCFLPFKESSAAARWIEECHRLLEQREGRISS